MHLKLSPTLALTLFAITSTALPTPQSHLPPSPPAEEPKTEYDSNSPLIALIESKLALPKSWHLNSAELKSALPEPEPAPAPAPAPAPTAEPASAPPPQGESSSPVTTQDFLTIQSILEEFHGRGTTLLSRRSPSRRKQEAARLAAAAAEAEKRQQEEQKQAEQSEGVSAGSQSEGEGENDRGLTAKEFDELFEKYREMYDVNVAKAPKDKGKNLRFGGFVEAIMAPPGRSPVDGQSEPEV